jgi:hypothetical protein
MRKTGSIGGPAKLRGNRDNGIEKKPHTKIKIHRK